MAAVLENNFQIFPVLVHMDGKGSTVFHFAESIGDEVTEDLFKFDQIGKDWRGLLREVFVQIDTLRLHLRIKMTEGIFDGIPDLDWAVLDPGALTDCQ